MNFFHRLFKTESGDFVIAQKPNAPLYLAVIFFMLRIFKIELLDTISFWGLFVTLGYWSILEILNGVNTFRKLLGLVVLLFQVVKIINLIW